MPTNQKVLLGVLAIAFASGVLAITTFAIEKTIASFASRGHSANIRARAAIEKRERDAAATATRFDRRREP